MKPPTASKPRERVLTDAELAEVFTKAHIHQYSFGRIVTLLILTGMRRNEVAHLEWDWIDPDERIITLPSTLTKNKHTHTIPYGSLTFEPLEGLSKNSKSLFPSVSEKGTVFNGWGKSKARFDKELENVEPYTLHDLRRTFATVHAKIGTPIHVTEKLLNHVSGTISGVAAVYNRHSYMDEMRTAVTAYDKYLENLINP
ncbi:site-specific integrase [Amylibacter sp. SFDW26]|uniref:site-specific integrase n=1 Tax=Amylibacter sp. SFDW26 TaxID=2652722 RepID=UPI001D00731D|nr:site-specific integrase [Amylibacter sp. SFDW26]